MCCLAATTADICGVLKLANFQDDSTAEIKENTHTPQLKQRIEVEPKTSSLKEISLQNPETLRNSPQRKNYYKTQHYASITPRTVKTKAKKRLTISQLIYNGDDKICPLTKTTSLLFEKRLWDMRHGQALWISVLHLSSWKVYRPLDFVKYLITEPIWLVV